MGGTPRPGTISWTDLTVADADAVCEFYQAVTGWAPEPESWTPVPQPEAPVQTTVEAPMEAMVEAPAEAVVEAMAEALAEAPAPPPAPEPLMQTLTAAIDILPQRTSLRTALRRGRRRGDPQATSGLPFNGGFDPIAPAREFARREGFGAPESEQVAVAVSPETSVASATATGRPFRGTRKTVEPKTMNS